MSGVDLDLGVKTASQGGGSSSRNFLAEVHVSVSVSAFMPGRMGDGFDLVAVWIAYESPIIVRVIFRA